MAKSKSDWLIFDFVNTTYDRFEHFAHNGLHVFRNPVVFLWGEIHVP